MGELCGSCVGRTVWGSCAESCVERCVVGAVCDGAVCDGAVCGARSHQIVQAYIHMSLPPVLPAQGGFPTTLSPIAYCPVPVPHVPAHRSSQVVHCRVCPPHPLHAPVLVLHLAVYPASPTQGRVGSLTGCHTVHRHSAM